MIQSNFINIKQFVQYHYQLKVISKKRGQINCLFIAVFELHHAFMPLNLHKHNVFNNSPSIIPNALNHVSSFVLEETERQVGFYIIRKMTISQIKSDVHVCKAFLIACHFSHRRNQAEILPTRRKTPFNQ